MSKENEEEMFRASSPGESLLDENTEPVKELQQVPKPPGFWLRVFKIIIQVVCLVLLMAKLAIIADSLLNFGGHTRPGLVQANVIISAFVDLAIVALLSSELFIK